ncbi:MAG: terminase [Mucilaginibacter sp.]|nr:terminase [Mucilaginibacter sp.]
MPVIIKDAGPFKKLYDLPEDTNLVICIGGRGGRKTYELSKFIVYKTAIKRKRAVLLRDEKALIKETILNDIWKCYDRANSNGAFEAIYSKNESELKEKATGNVLLYTKGFRASNNTKGANLKGASDIDIALIEEAEDIRDPEKYNTFVDSLRKQGCLIIILMNTPDIGHFLIRRYFTTEHVLDENKEPTGYFNLIPKDHPGFVCIKTSFEDNPHLPEHVVYNYKAYGDKNSITYDYHYYMTAIKGYASTGRKGQVFTKVKPIKLADYMKLKLVEYYGQDFGTASPAAMVGVKFDGNTAYVRLINYKPMPVLELAKLYCRLKFTPQDRIVCDYADSSSIGKLANGFDQLSAQEYMDYPGLGRGFYAVPCPAKDISADISLVSGMNVYFVEEHQELWEEVNNYVYAQDKNGNYTDEPIDAFNHAMDAMRYIIADQRRYSNSSAY